MKLSEKERKEYNAYLKRLRDIASEQHTKMADAQDLILAEKKGEENKEIEAIIGFFEIGVSTENIAKALKVSINRVAEIIEKHKSND